MNSKKPTQSINPILENRKKLNLDQIRSDIEKIQTKNLDTVNQFYLAYQTKSLSVVQAIINSQDSQQINDALEKFTYCYYFFKELAKEPTPILIFYKILMKKLEEYLEKIQRRQQGNLTQHSKIFNKIGIRHQSTQVNTVKINKLNFPIVQQLQRLEINPNKTRKDKIQTNQQIKEFKENNKKKQNQIEGKTTKTNKIMEPLKNVGNGSVNNIRDQKNGSSGSGNLFYRFYTLLSHLLVPQQQTVINGTQNSQQTNASNNYPIQRKIAMDKQRQQIKKTNSAFGYPQDQQSQSQQQLLSKDCVQSIMEGIKIQKNDTTKNINNQQNNSTKLLRNLSRQGKKSKDHQDKVLKDD